MKTTTDHNRIRLWAEAHKGRPEILQDSNGTVLRLDFPGKTDDAYLGVNLGEKRISWDEFFEEFERQQLAFEFNEEIIGDASNEYRFIRREEI